MKRIRFQLLTASILALLIISGCALRRDVVTVDRRVSAMNQRVMDLENRCRELDAQVNSYRDTRSTEDSQIRGQSAELRVELRGLRDEIQQLRGRIEENEFQLKQKMGELKKPGGQDEQEINKLIALSDSNEAQIKRLEEYLNTGTAGKKATGTGTAPPKETSAESTYTSAKAAFDKGDFQKALEGFQNFLKKYPDSPNADNAQFWIGEIYYREKWYEKAILEYQSVIEKYPKGNKVRAALLKQGLAFLDLGDKANSRLILDELIRKYPDSNEARIARDKLKSM